MLHALFCTSLVLQNKCWFLWSFCSKDILSCLPEISSYNSPWCCILPALNIQGVYINCQKLISLLGGKYQLNIVYFGIFVLHMSSHLSTTCKIPPTMKKSLNITSWINGWFSAWTQNGDFSEWKKNIIWHKYLSAHVFRVVHTKIYHNYIKGVS